MQIALPYGRSTLEVEVPAETVVVRSTDLPGLPHPASAVRHALATPTSGRPLHQILGTGDHQGHSKIAVVFPDITRPMPNRIVLPPLLAALGELGVDRDRIVLLCATGTHRPATHDELVALVGPEIVEGYDIGQHDSDDADAHVEVGILEGTRVLLDRRYVEADVRICTGFVEPHFFAGFSGGPKAVCPGLAATETILEAHSRTRIADTRATWLHTHGNPVHDFVRTAVSFALPDISIDVAINAARELTAVFAGAPWEGHEAACQFVTRTAVTEIRAADEGRFDVVVTTNGGYPLDQNLYQSVKGMAAAERVVRDGGTVVLAAACADGIPAGGAFADLLATRAAVSASDRAVDPGERQVPDGWQAQVLDRVLARADVFVHAAGLSDDDVRSAGLLPAPDLQAAIDGACRSAARVSGRPPRVCILVEGPLAVATVI